MSVRLEQLLDAATAADDDGRPWEWTGGYPQRILRAGDVAVVAEAFEDPDSPSRFAEFIALADPPTVRAMCRLLIDMGEEVTAITQRKPVEQMWGKQEDVDRVRALLARLDTLGKDTA